MVQVRILAAERCPAAPSPIPCTTVSSATASHHGPAPEPQDVTAPLTAAAAFLVLRVGGGDAATATARSVLAATSDLVENVRIRSDGTPFSCNVGIADRVWERLVGGAKPRELAPFREIAGATHTAVATDGDLLYHLRADSTDLIVEFEKLLLEAFGDAVATVDETAGFRYFHGRDLLEFLDGTANPDGADLPAATLVGDEDPAHAGGSYVVVQKYLHDMAAWRALSVEDQERIVGRTKFDNVELPDAEEGQKSHKTLCTITDDDGTEHDILRDNMPFAAPGRGEYGTYFIGYSRRLRVIEAMLERMYVGDPPPLHDRILDFSTRARAARSSYRPGRCSTASTADTPPPRSGGPGGAACGGAAAALRCCVRWRRGQLSSAASRVISTPVSAFDTGQPALAASAAFAKPSASRPVTSPRTFSAIPVSLKPPLSLSGPSETSADTSSDSGVPPASATFAESCIAKQAECAAAMSSSGLVVPPASSAARFGKLTS